MDYTKNNIICDTIKNLVGKRFYGYYPERRYVSKIQDYRDLILIDKHEEHIHKLIDKTLKTLLDQNSAGDFIVIQSFVYIIHL